MKALAAALLVAAARALAWAVHIDWMEVGDDRDD